MGKRQNFQQTKLLDVGKQVLDKKKRALKIIIAAFGKDYTGTYFIDIIISPTNKEYHYELISIYQLNRTKWLIDKKRYGKALKYLKENNINEIYN